MMGGVMLGIEAEGCGIVYMEFPEQLLITWEDTGYSRNNRDIVVVIDSLL
jgi:hypothetical protein